MSKAAQAVQDAIEQHRRGRSANAIALLQRVLRREPRHADANNVLGVILLESGEPARAEFHLRRAVQAAPERAALHANLGNALVALDRLDDAEASFRRAVAAEPDYPGGHLGLANALTMLNRNEDAADAAREVLKRQPDSLPGLMSLGGALLGAGRVEQAAETFREAVERFPRRIDVHQRYLAALSYLPAVDENEVFEAHRRSGRLIGELAPRIGELNVEASAEPDVLRVGYVSSDLRSHSVAFFIEPVIAARDRDRFMVACYSTSSRADGTTRRIRDSADLWVDASRLDDEALLRRIRDDGIHVLVELNGHTLGNRLRALAGRAAPVQATWIGYPNTTGVEAIDFRIVDAATDPPGAEAHATETLVRLDDCFLCYRPLADAPEPSPPPMGQAGHATFGSFNTLPKFGEPVLDAWAELLRRVPGSRLLLKNLGLADPRARQRLEAYFQACGVEPSRIEAIGQTPTQAEHLALYRRIDVALDTFPYNGTTTTCEALWMGVPVVAIRGNCHRARVSASLLDAAGLNELVAPDVEGYIRLAADLAGDSQRLDLLRRTLRSQLAQSPLRDEASFAARIEEACREMWRMRAGRSSRSP